MADSVEKLGVLVVILAAASNMARDDLLELPSSVHMTGFVG